MMYRFRMTRKATRSSAQVLADNLLAAMDQRWGGKHIRRLGADVLKTSGGQATRVLSGEQNTGVDAIDRIASAWDLEPWQLLVPGLDLQKPPALAGGIAPAVAARFSLDVLQRIGELDARSMARLETMIRLHLDMPDPGPAGAATLDPAAAAPPPRSGQTHPMQAAVDAAERELAAKTTEKRQLQRRAADRQA